MQKGSISLIILKHLELICYRHSTHSLEDNFLAQSKMVEQLSKLRNCSFTLISVNVIHVKDSFRSVFVDIVRVQVLLIGQTIFQNPLSVHFKTDFLASCLNNSFS